MKNAPDYLTGYKIPKKPVDDLTVSSKKDTKSTTADKNNRIDLTKKGSSSKRAHSPEKDSRIVQTKSNAGGSKKASSVSTSGSHAQRQSVKELNSRTSSTDTKAEVRKRTTARLPKTL